MELNARLFGGLVRCVVLPVRAHHEVEVNDKEEKDNERDGHERLNVVLHGLLALAHSLGVNAVELSLLLQRLAHFIPWLGFLQRSL